MHFLPHGHSFQLPHSLETHNKRLDRDVWSKRRLLGLHPESVGFVSCRCLIAGLSFCLEGALEEIWRTYYWRTSLRRIVGFVRIRNGRWWVFLLVVCFCVVYSCFRFVFVGGHGSVCGALSFASSVAWFCGAKLVLAGTVLFRTFSDCESLEWTDDTQLVSSSGSSCFIFAPPSIFFSLSLACLSIFPSVVFPVCVGVRFFGCRGLSKAGAKLWPLLYKQRHDCTSYFGVYTNKCHNVAAKKPGFQGIFRKLCGGIKFSI